MKVITDQQARQVLRNLYNAAEKDPSDHIANAASALAVKLETTKRHHFLSELEQRIIQHAQENHPAIESQTPEPPRRKTYRRRLTGV